MNSARIGLGTVQFGLAYGVTNSRGQVSLDKARAILAVATKGGVEILDTAAVYGESEAVLGVLVEEAAAFRVVSKTIPQNAERFGDVEADAVKAGLERSLERLQRPQLDAFLVHHSTDLLCPGGDRLVRLLEDARAEGLVRRIGVSVYSPAELAEVLKRFTPQLVQLPFNLFDQRFATSGMLARLKEFGCEIHARSLFLQGTLLAAPEALPAGLSHARHAFDAVKRFVMEQRLERIAACLGCGLAQPELDCLVLGVTDPAELADILSTVAHLPACLPDFSALSIEDETILNPAKWRLA